MTLFRGTRLGPYDVVELLGAGGMGEVYRARDPRLGREVAIKVLPAEVACDPDRLRRFEQEARAVAALNHPHILTVHDVGTHEGVPYVVTELLEGENLRELVSRRTPTVRQILAYALQAARGLEAAHAKDIVHRDLKPENLFLTTDGQVKILDFGLAKLVRREQLRTDAPTPSGATAVGQVVGTVAYMSPEQARGHPVDARSDVFSFGVVLHELLARKHPFLRDTAAATLTAIVEETPAALESLGLGIPPAVGGIVRRCLEKDRQDRYGSSHDVMVALETVLEPPDDARQGGRRCLEMGGGGKDRLAHAPAARGDSNQIPRTGQRELPSRKSQPAVAHRTHQQPGEPLDDPRGCGAGGHGQSHPEPLGTDRVHCEARAL